jgi:hypothetical protein
MYGLLKGLQGESAKNPMFHQKLFVVSLWAKVW